MIAFNGLKEWQYVIIAILSFLAEMPSAAQSKKPCYQKFYGVTDVLPVLVSPIEEVIAALENEITIPDSLKTRKGSLLISYVITCNGDVTKLKLIKKGDWDGTIFYQPFEVLLPQIKQVIARELRYKAAVQQGSTVDFFQILSLRFENGRIFLGLNGS